MDWHCCCDGYEEWERSARASAHVHPVYDARVEVTNGAHCCPSQWRQQRSAHQDTRDRASSGCSCPSSHRLLTWTGAHGTHFPSRMETRHHRVSNSSYYSCSSLCALYGHGYPSLSCCVQCALCCRRDLQTLIACDVAPTCHFETETNCFDQHAPSLRQLYAFSLFLKGASFQLIRLLACRFVNRFLA